MTPEGKLRLLFLLPFPPRIGGRHGGARVTGQLLAALARRHAVAALFLARPGEPPVEEELVRLCDRLELVEHDAVSVGLRQRVKAKLDLLRAFPTWANELAHPTFGACVAELAKEWMPDVVQLEYPVMGQYLAALDHCSAPRVLVDHDASLRDPRRWGGPFPRITAALDERAWRRFERGVIEGVDAVVVHTERDQRALEGLGISTSVLRAPFGVPIPAAPLDPSGSLPPGVLFVGNFGHPANTDAALWLAGTIFPPLRSARPDAQLTIVGPSPPPDLLALAGNGVVVTGEVADLTPYLDQAAVVAAPLRVGGGMRVKVLEALAAGKAVVASPLAAEGLDVVAGQELEIAGSADDFRRALLRLLDEEEARRALGARARAWAGDHLGWEAVVASYEGLYGSLLRG